jgi:hypothetical protein
MSFSASDFTMANKRCDMSMMATDIHNAPSKTKWLEKLWVRITKSHLI